MLRKFVSWRLLGAAALGLWLSATGASAAELDYFDLNDTAVATDDQTAQVGFLQDLACGTGIGCSDSCGGCGDACCGTGCCDTGCGPILPELLFSPMTNPLFFEDPRTLTEIRGIFITHKVPQDALGGRVNLMAVQLRAAVNDRLSIVASKDGYFTSTNPLIDDGWADVGLGLKYQLLADPCCGQLLSAGFAYELPVGSPRTAQGNGDGEFHIYLTGGTRIGSRGHWLSASGFRLPVDGDAESTVWYWSNHFDTQIRKGVYAFTEFNWYHWAGAGTNAGLNGIEGLDVFNFGSTGVAGNDIVTGAFGLKLKPNRKTEIGVAWEVPLTDRRDIIDNRLTADLILRY
jgi:hypothetical protein